MVTVIFLSSSFFIHSEIKPASHHFCLSSGVLLRFRELQGFPGTCSECFHTRQAALGLAGWSEREKARLKKNQLDIVKFRLVAL